MKLKNYLDGAENHNPLTTFTEPGCCLHTAANLNDDQVVFTMIKSRAQLAQERLRREHERMGIVPPRPVSLISERDTDLNKPPLKKEAKPDDKNKVPDEDPLFTMDSDSKFNDDDLFCCEEEEPGVSLTKVKELKPLISEQVLVSNDFDCCHSPSSSNGGASQMTDLHSNRDSPDIIKSKKNREFKLIMEESDQRKLDSETMSKRDFKIPEKFIVCDNYL